MDAPEPTPACGLCGYWLPRSYQDGDYCDECWKKIDSGQIADPNDDLGTNLRPAACPGGGGGV